jgi:uncharacterized membrane protein
MNGLAARKIARVTAAIFYATAGFLHIRQPVPFVKIVPPFIPWPLAAVYVSGIAEIAGGAALLLPSLRRSAAWGLTALLIAVFPANVYMAMDRVQVTSSPLPDWLLWARLPLQAGLIWWVLWCSKEYPTEARAAS